MMISFRIILVNVLKKKNVQHKCRIWNIEREYNMGDVVLGISIINGLGVIKCLKTELTNI